MIRLDAVSASVLGATARMGPRRILHDLGIEFRPGESHLILGPNGCGKTTLIRLLAGLHPPTSGQVLLDGAPIARHRSAPSLWPHVAVLFEEPDPQFLTDSVEAEIAFGLESLALSPDEIRFRTAEAIDSLGLAGFEGRAPHTLSAGEKARTLLAAVMAAGPRVLLLDQSLAHLDPCARYWLECRLLDEAGSGRFTLIRTHQDADPPHPGERVHVIERGRLIDAAGIPPRAVLDADLVPLPLAMRVTALLAVYRMWDGPLETHVALMRVGLTSDHSVAFAHLSSEGAETSPRESPPSPVRDFRGRQVVLALDSVALATRGSGQSRPLIADVSLELHEGEVVAIVGQSGSGKSTILKLAASLLAPTTGSIHYAMPVDQGRRVALALEYPERQLFGRTVEEDVTAILWVDGVPEVVRRARGREAMERVGLDHDLFAARVPLTLSEGEKRRVALASLLADPPRALLLDEPTAGLDPGGRRALASVIRGLSEGGHSILMASHDLDFVSAVADRVVVLGREGQEPGRILGAGAPPSIWNDWTVMKRASLPQPDFIVAEHALRGPAIPSFGPVRDAESLMEALAHALEGHNAAEPASSSRSEGGSELR